jgi:hypothetical protein
MWIVITGNPIAGISCHGPFNASDSAVEWAEKELVNSEPDCWVSELHPVNDHEET